MIDNTRERLLRELSTAVAEHIGLHYPESRWSDLERAVDRVAAEWRLRSARECIEWLLEPGVMPQRLDTFAEYLTVGETHFFRDERLFKALEERILPDLIADRRMNGRRLTIWSAGCATGEEPYSLAILLSRLMTDLTWWDVKILGTDINRRFLEKAADGVYSDWSFRSVPEPIKAGYFTRTADATELHPEIARMVEFSRLNLIKSSYPFPGPQGRKADLILCRNVIMYFTEENQRAVLENLARGLTDDGWLIVSGTEASCVSMPPFKQYSINGSIVFRKTDEKSSMTFLPFPDETPHFTEDIMADLVPDPDSLIGVGTYHIEGIPSENESRSSRDIPEMVADPQEQEARDFGIVETDPVSEGVTLFQFGRYPEAVEKLRDALGRANGGGPQRAQAMCVLTKAYANQGKLDEALQWAEKTVGSDKVNADFHYLHATILQELGRPEEAAAALNRAVFLEPDFVVAHVSLGNLARARGNMKSSARHYRTALTALDQSPADEMVPGSEGLTVEEMRGIIRSAYREETAHGSA